MTVLDLPRTAEPTPQSQRLDELERMLENPKYTGFRAEIQQSIDELRAKTTLGT